MGPSPGGPVELQDVVYHGPASNNAPLRGVNDVSSHEVERPGHQGGEELVIRVRERERKHTCMGSVPCLCSAILDGTLGQERGAAVIKVWRDLRVIAHQPQESLVQ
eukprot:7483914-Pyramimonas_sp.AAC.1